MMTINDHAVEMLLAAHAAAAHAHHWWYQRRGPKAKMSTYPRLLDHMLRRADPFVWTKETATRCGHTIPTFPKLATLNPHDLVVPAQWHVIEGMEEWIPYDAGARARRLAGFLIADGRLATSIVRAPDALNALNGLWMFRFMQERGDAPIAVSAAFWTYGQLWDDMGIITDEEWPEDDNESMQVAYALLQFGAIAQFWLRGTAEAITTQPLSRPTRRRLTKASWPLADVRVIHKRAMTPLDEPDDELDSPQARQWRGRWYVSEHYRHLPSDRVTLVHEHIKGPEGKPLLLRRERIYRVDR